MLLLSTSAALRKAFHIKPVEETLTVKTEDWYRFWSIDARVTYNGTEVMLFTNHETLYTFVADAKQFKTASDMIMYFAKRYSDMFHQHFGYNGRVQERLVVHKASDRRVIGVMNSYFHSIDFYADDMNFEDMEFQINRTPIVSRNIFPGDYLLKKLKEDRR